MDYWVRFSFGHPSSLHLKAKFMKKNRSHTIVSIWCKQAPITYESLGLLQRNKDFQIPLEQANKVMSRFVLLHPFFTKKETFKKFMDFFQKYTNMHTMYSMLYIGLCDYVLSSQIWSHISLLNDCSIREYGSKELL